MRGTAGRIAIVCASAALAAACSTSPEPGPSVAGVTLPTGNGVYKIGEPYEEEGVWYYPREQPEYDETGIASWYGGDFHGRRTANGEVFDANGLTAAHPTLPMPVNVQVTNLENGRSIVLRVNDRGPFKRGRIIDVSARAAQLLGFYGKGTAKVRVTYLARADQPGAPFDSAATAAVAAAPTAAVQVASLEPVTAAPAMTAPPPAVPAAQRDASADVPSPSPEKLDAKFEANSSTTVLDTNAEPATHVATDEQPARVTTVPVPAVSHLYVQLGAFSIKDNAERLRNRLSAAGAVNVSPIDRKGHTLYRVRLGPFDEVSAADSALAAINALGDSDAKIIVDR